MLFEIMQFDSETPAHYTLVYFMVQSRRCCSSHSIEKQCIRRQAFREAKSDAAFNFVIVPFSSLQRVGM